MDEKYLEITPKNKYIPTKEYNFEEKVDIFYKCIKGWILDVADMMINDKEKRIDTAGIAVVILTVSLFEMFGKYIIGAGNTLKNFQIGFKYVYLNTKLTDIQIKDIYIECRCAIAHEGLSSPRIIYNSTFEPTIKDINNEQPNCYGISPNKIVIDFKNALERYKNELLDTECDELKKKNFLKQFERKERK